MIWPYWSSYEVENYLSNAVETLLFMHLFLIGANLLSLLVVNYKKKFNPQVMYQFYASWLAYVLFYILLPPRPGAFFSNGGTPEDLFFVYFPLACLAPWCVAILCFLLRKISLKAPALGASVAMLSTVAICSWAASEIVRHFIQGYGLRDYYPYGIMLFRYLGMTALVAFLGSILITRLKSFDKKVA